MNAEKLLMAARKLYALRKRVSHKHDPVLRNKLIVAETQYLIISDEYAKSFEAL